MKLIRNRSLPTLLLTVAMLFLAVLPCAADTPAAPVTADPPTVSYGLSVLSARTDIALSAMAGNDILFSADAIARGLNLSSVKYITVQSVPPVTDGELLLGSSRIVAGQTVSAEHLSSMVFHPAGDTVKRSGFSLSANGSATPVICRLYLLNEQNTIPTVSMVSELSLQVGTYRDLPAHGLLSAYDPDGDHLCFEIISYPQSGCLELTDSTQGSYVYRPNAGFVGSDSFSYVARDPYGNYSARATVNLRVELSGTAVTYVDLQDSQACNAAIKLTEAGIMSGTQVGNQYYFYPNQSVSRVEFLVMAMNAAGISEVPDCKATAFADDAEIPESMKGYVAAAHTLGYINGSEVDGKLCFRPNDALTRAEAAVMLEAVLGLEDARVIPTFADHAEIPVWAADAVYSLHAAGILLPKQGCISAKNGLTRAETAELLAAVVAYCK